MRLAPAVYCPNCNEPQPPAAAGTFRSCAGCRQVFRVPARMSAAERVRADMRRDERARAGAKRHIRNHAQRMMVTLPAMTRAQAEILDDLVQAKLTGMDVIDREDIAVHARLANLAEKIQHALAGTSAKAAA